MNKRGPIQLRSRYRVLLLLMLSVSLLLAFPLAAGAYRTDRPADQTSWTLVWSDEFNGSGGVSSANWIYDLGTGYGCAGCPSNWGTGEVESATNSTNNVFQSGGNLNIRALHTGSNPATGWTSGRIETVRTDFQPPAGRIMAVEGRIQQPNVNTTNGLGYWPAFWMLGAPFRGNYLNWPGVGEIDILEDINGRSSEFGTLHCGTSPGGPCNETTGLGSGERACAGCQTGFHTYRIEFDKSVSPQRIRWYLDGANFFTVTANQVDATTWNNATNHGFFLILDLAIGGGFPAAFGGGPTAATVSGGTLLVDYVRVYYSNSGPTATPTRTPTPGGPTATPTRTPTPGSCPSGSFLQGVVNVSATQTRPWFQPCGWTAGYVILHYIRPGLVQQNVNMTFNSGNGRWELTFSGLSSGQTLQYQFTYQKGGLQFDTSWFSWTKP